MIILWSTIVLRYSLKKQILSIVQKQCIPLHKLSFDRKISYLAVHSALAGEKHDV